MPFDLRLDMGSMRGLTRKVLLFMTQDYKTVALKGPEPQTPKPRSNPKPLKP